MADDYKLPWAAGLLITDCSLRAEDLSLPWR